MSNYSEEEQIALIKDWWQRNGKPLMLGVAVAIAIIFGWKYWQNQQNQQSQLLSSYYQQILDLTEQGKTEELPAALKQLQQAAPKHAYTQQAQLMLARLALESERLDDAAEHLQAIVSQPANDVLKELASQRLARVLSAQDKQEQALKLLEGKGLAAYQSMRDELRGDILLRLGREEEARTAYQAASKAQDGKKSEILMMKLDDLSQKDA